MDEFVKGVEKPVNFKPAVKFSAKSFKDRDIGFNIDKPFTIKIPWEDASINMRYKSGFWYYEVYLKGNKVDEGDYPAEINNLDELLYKLFKDIGLDYVVDFDDDDSELEIEIEEWYYEKSKEN